jgi:hypothetical protein
MMGWSGGGAADILGNFVVIISDAALLYLQLI